MALLDILPDPGDTQDMILENPQGSLGTPTDILFSYRDSTVEEIPAKSGGGGTTSFAY